MITSIQNHLSRLDQQAKIETISPSGPEGRMALLRHHHPQAVCGGTFNDVIDLHIAIRSYIASPDELLG